MKKTLTSFAILFVLSVSISSCSKNYNCHCVYQTNGVTSHEDDTKMSYNSKSKATDACNQRNSSTSSTVGGNTYVNTTSCTIN